MARWDVYRLRDGERVVDCQANIQGQLGTRFVISIVPFDSGYPVKQGLNPVVQFQDEKIIVVTEAASTILVRDIAESLGSLDAAHDRIVQALDFLTGGF